MGEEKTQYRLEQHDKELQAIKDEIKGINNNVTNIQIIDASMQKDMKRILDTFIIIQNTVIGFVVLNILAMLWTLGKKLG